MHTDVVRMLLMHSNGIRMCARKLKWQKKILHHHILWPLCIVHQVHTSDKSVNIVCYTHRTKEIHAMEDFFFFSKIDKLEINHGVAANNSCFLSKKRRRRTKPCNQIEILRQKIVCYELIKKMLSLSLFYRESV